MPVITLTSDWRNADYYVAALKGKILSDLPVVTLVDISHNIAPFSVSQAAFVIGNSYSHFPPGTVHIVAVSTEAMRDRPHVAVHANGQFFISTDNGLFGLLFPSLPVDAIAVEEDEGVGHSFGALSVFASLAVKLAGGTPLADLGTRHTDFYRQVPILPTIDEAVINGSILYIDSYANAISNISLDNFSQASGGRKFEIYIQSNRYKITRLNIKYSESPVGELLALFNSAGLLEIAINQGNAAQLLNLGIGSAVRIKFL